MTVLWFAPKPARCSCAISRTSGKRSRTASAEPSSDALSSTTTSACSARRDSRQASSRSRLFVLTIETERSVKPGSTREAARDECLACRVDGVGGLLAVEPREQVLHAALERDLGAEAEQLLGEACVGVAVADVARAVLLHDLRLDLLAEAARDHLGDLEHRRRHAGAEVD